MSDWSDIDRQHMARAIQLAKKGWYSTHPNPRVGCVLVNEGQHVGEGWHVRAGEGHAEVNALREAGEKAKGATAYVSLEPCSHFGKTPPCSQALIDAGVSRVIAAMSDPNPLVAGKGLAMLKEAGIDTSSGLLEEQARALNPGFIKRMSEGRPFVRLKVAVSVDGRTAMASGESKWITGEDARRDVHRLRASSAAVLSTAATVMKDDARLTVRLEAKFFPDGDAPEPIRVVLDKAGMLSGDETFFKERGHVIYVHDVARQPPLTIDGREQVTCLAMPLDHSGYFDLQDLLEQLSLLQINEVLVEAGPGLIGQCIEQGCVDELIVYMAPKLMGSSALPMAGLNFEKMSEARELRLLDACMVGDDFRFTYEIQ